MLTLDRWLVWGLSAKGTCEKGEPEGRCNVPFIGSANPL